MFFAERDKALLEALRRRLTAEEAEKVLIAATGVLDQIRIPELAGLPVPQFLAVLGIFPMVQVAWSDRKISAHEREAMLAAAAEVGVHVGTPCHDLLGRWLQTRPPDNAESLWSEYVQAVCATLRPETVAILKEGVMERARKVAEASGGLLGLGNKISAREQACLDRMAQAFNP
jgi:hypothetical protein